MEFVSDRYRYVASQHVADSAKRLQKLFILNCLPRGISLFNRKSGKKFIFLLFIGLLIVAAISLTCGQIKIPLHNTLSAIGYQLGLPFFDKNDFTQEQMAVVWYIRMPRMVVGLLVGAALGISGAVMQGIFSNPLADPGIIGVSSGAATGAVLSIALGWATESMFMMPTFAFCGSVCAVSLTVFLACVWKYWIMTLLACRRRCGDAAWCGDIWIVDIYE